MSSSISSVHDAPRKPEVSIAVWTPIALAPRSSVRTYGACSSGSPPESVSPPPVAFMTPR